MTSKPASRPEQGAICAYCGRRISTRGYDQRHERGGMKVEHFASRADHPQRMFDWQNLLGVCGGEEIVGASLVETCDTARGNEVLHIHPGVPTPPRPEDVFTFRRHPPGEQDPPYAGVWIHGLTQQAEDDIDTLQLNAGHLVRRRRDAQRAFANTMRRHRDNTRRQRAVLRGAWRACTDGDGTGLLEYAPMMRQYLEPKLALLT